jgi:hypothetical protein
MKLKTAPLIGALALFMSSTSGCGPSPRWGYLANSGSPVPIKGVYFFTGDAWPDQTLYTFTPLDPATHLHWTSDPYARKRVLDMMGNVGINVITMSYWGSDISSAPMQSTEDAGDRLFDAAKDRGIPIIPSIEVASGLPNHYAKGDFVKTRLLHLIDHYLLNKDHPDWAAEWAKVFDQSGQARYAVQLLGAASNSPIDGDGFVTWLDTLADSVRGMLPAPIGFVIEPARADAYTPNPGVTRFERAHSFLAIQGFLSEIDTPGFAPCQATPYCDNNGLLPANHPAGAGNMANREAIAALKRNRLAGWIGAGLPVIIDVNPGFDGRYVWGHVAGYPQFCTKDADCGGELCNTADRKCHFRNGGGVVEHEQQCRTDDECFGQLCNAQDHKCHLKNGYWGDNAFYYDDFFRNYMSELRGMGNVGITFSSWNQYTEGSVAVPSLRVPVQGKPQDTGRWNSVQFNWLKDMYAGDPRQCSHVHYVDGGLSKFYVYGAICEHWQSLSHDSLPPSFAVGEPITSEMDTPGKRGRMNRFSKDQGRWAIYWSGKTNAHEVHGGIYLKYLSMTEDKSYLGLPTTDELPSTAWCDNGRYNAFEGGWIDWCPDGRVWGHSNPTQGFPGRDQ